LNDVHKLNQEIIVTLSCLALGGLKKKVHTEEIAVKSHQLSNKFSWALEKYNKFPDIARVRKGIDRAKNNGWLVGGYSTIAEVDGWQISEKGNNDIQKYIHFIKLKKNTHRLTQADERVLNKLKKSFLYKSYLSNMDEFEVNEFDLAEAFNSNSNPTFLRTKFFNLKKLIQLSEDEALIRFSDNLIKKLPDILNEELYTKENTVRAKQQERVIKL
tara:strand:+ start:335 stop:979 length:645 start_codon:yes stop_codon:yes gene_type:complete